MKQRNVIIFAGTANERSIALEKAVYRIGRSAGADIVIDSKNISGVHLSLIVQDDSVELLDQDSTNGTTVNGERITRTTLHDGDRVGMADVTLVFRETEMDDAVKTAIFMIPTLQNDKNRLDTLFERLLKNGSLSKEETREIESQFTVSRRDSGLLERLNGLLARALSITDRDDLITLLLREIRELMQLEITGVYLVDEQRFCFLEDDTFVSESEHAIVSKSVLRQVIESKKAIVFDHIDSAGEGGGFKSLLRFKIRSLLCFPVFDREKKVLGAFYCISRQPDRLKLLEGDRKFLDACSSFISLALENITLLEREKRNAYTQAKRQESERYSPIISRLSQEKENLTLKLGAPASPEFFGLDRGCNSQLNEFLEKSARTGLPVLLTGETGCGKTLLARKIHDTAGFNGPFVTIDCTTIPAELLESELFGYEKGAFTGAYSRKAGKVTVSQNGTLFIDEISELATELQGKLLRLIQSGEYEPLGGTQVLRSNARLIAATNRDLRNEVAQRKFREDLYFRLNVLHYELSPLRSHPENIEPLSEHFLRTCGAQFNPGVKGFTDEALKAMRGYSWPGNVRELENAVMRALVNASGDRIDAADLALEERIGVDRSGSRTADSATDSLDLKLARERIDRLLIARALDKTDSNVSQAAKLLNVSRNSLMDLIKKYELG